MFPCSAKKQNLRTSRPPHHLICVEVNLLTCFKIEQKQPCSYTHFNEMLKVTEIEIIRQQKKKLKVASVANLIAMS